MKCLTIYEPNASAVIFGPKPFENRPARYRHRGDLAIHAGVSRRGYSTLSLSLLSRHWPGFPADEVAMLNHAKRWTMGMVIGVVELVDVVRPESRVVRSSRYEEFGFGPWCLVLARPRGLRIPFRAKGRQGLWDIDDDAIARAEPFDVPAGNPFARRIPA